MDNVLEYLEQHREEMLEDLKTLVLAESPTRSKERVDQCGAEIQRLFKKHLHLDSEVIPQKHAGNHLRFSYGTGDEQILILGHFDTVWDVGRLSYRVEGNRAYGPGILDMKGESSKLYGRLKPAASSRFPSISESFSYARAMKRLEAVRPAT
ncbi:hypothetical protein LJK88_14080 [Paenibacillus sp. P26]|nr:hypothetical protein LJK88_14080 [Paenibacillus sp. P26]UUZ97911.1 hypothetical protein LJK87_23665 [Paenibacillus sp. P25]